MNNTDFFSDEHWDHVMEENNEWIEQMAEHIEGNDPDAKRIQLADIAVDDDVENDR